MLLARRAASELEYLWGRLAGAHPREQSAGGGIPLSTLALLPARASSHAVARLSK